MHGHMYRVGREHLKPAAYTIDLGLDNVVLDLFGDEEFCKLRAEGAQSRQHLTNIRLPGSYYQGAFYCH